MPRLLFSGHAVRDLLGHQNTVVRLEGKKLVGLPAEYSPAELDLDAFRLRIGRHLMEFTPLLRSFFERQPYDLEVSASWYHDDADGTLPPYIVLQVTPKGRDYSYSVALALDTLRLIDISISLRGAAGPPETNTMQTLQVALTEYEKQQIKKSVTSVR